MKIWECGRFIAALLGKQRSSPALKRLRPKAAMNRSHSRFSLAR